MKPIARGAVGALIFVALSVASLAAARTGDADAFDRYVRRLPPANRIVIKTMGTTKTCFEGAGTPDEKSCAFVYTPLASLELRDEKAAPLGRLWRGLKTGGGMGCFAPGYLLEFYSGENLLLSAHVCFHCRNVEIPEYGITSIDGDHKALERLQTFVTQALPYREPDGKDRK